MVGFNSLLFISSLSRRANNVLRLHAAVSWLRNDCSILAELGERVTQLQYLLQLSLRTSQNSVKAKFAEFGKGEVRRIPFLETV
jgi:hypothetical protein